MPHQVPWYTRLMGWAGLLTHPAGADALDPDGEDDGSPESSAAVFQVWWKEQFQFAGERKARNAIYDEMDRADLVAGILDLYCEEGTQLDYDTKRTVWIESPSNEIRNAGMECLRNLRIEETSAAVIRSMCKYGDRFQRLVYQGGRGVLAWHPVKDSSTVVRLSDKYHRLLGFKEDTKKYRGELKRDVSWPWDYVHFRLLGKDDASGYGTSILDSLYRAYRQLLMAEDSALMTRLRKGIERTLFMIDTGNLDEVEAMGQLNRWRKAFRKGERVNPGAAGYTKAFNPMNPLEDVFMPVRDGEQTRVENIAATSGIEDIFDLEYYRNKLFGTAKVPGAFLGFPGEINSKATLAQQDIRFARTIKRIVRHYVYGIRTTLDIHYGLLPTDADTSKYDTTKSSQGYIVQTAPISYLDEVDRIELLRLRHEILQSASTLATDLNLDPRTWASHLLLNYAKLPEEVVLKLVAKTDIPDTATDQAALESLSARVGPDKAKLIMDTAREQRKGAYSLSDKEKLAMAKMVHESPGLNKILNRFATTADEDAWQLQTDPAMDSFRMLNDQGKESPLFDSENTTAKMLLEDYRGLTGKGKNASRAAFADSKEPEAT